MNLISALVLLFLMTSSFAETIKITEVSEEIVLDNTDSDEIDLSDKEIIFTQQYEEKKDQTPIKKKRPIAKDLPNLRK